MSTRTVTVPPEFSKLFSESEKRVASYFARHRWDPTQGHIEIAGERYILIRSASLSVEYFQLIRSLYGPEQIDEADLFSANSLYDIGHNLGKWDARTIRESLQLDDPLELLAIGSVHASHAGWAFTELLPESAPLNDDSFVLYFRQRRSFESEAWLKNGEHSDYPVCAMNAGYAGGWCEESFGMALEVHELNCNTCSLDDRNPQDCLFIMAPPHRIHEQIENYLQAHPNIAQHYRSRTSRYPGVRSIPEGSISERQQDFLDNSHDLLHHARKLDSMQLALENKVSELQQEIKGRLSIEKKLQQLTSYDPLTGLANRNLFQDTVTRALSAHQRLGQSGALMFIDLDHFKKVNESLGHSVGDELLIEVAKRIESVIRPENTLARLGGDEFSLWFENTTNMHSIAKAAKTIITLLDNPITVQKQEIVITPSIGIALFPMDGNNAEELMRNAHSAMYHAKQLGRNTFQFFAQEMNLKARRRLDLEAMLRQAIEKQEITLHYQPKVNLATSQITGVEALARWVQPQAGRIFPADFIPLAEETGIIIPLGQYILEACCEFTRKLLDKKIHFGRVALNLSPRQFRRENLVENITETLAHYSIPPQCIELEITESALIDNPDRAIEILQRLKTLGIHLSIDDFGTGYSSLSYLQMFPLDTLKIDRSFIVGLLEGKRSLPASIVNLAHNLKLNVVAEGVEEVEQLFELRGMQCDEIQGFLFGKPMPGDALIQFLDQQCNKKLFSS